MRGYKGMDANMCCRGMQYEIGKTYRIGGELIVCKNGLHFCKNLVDVFEYYQPTNGNRFFIVEAIGEVQSQGSKSAASELKVVREVSEVELNRAHYGYGNGCGDGNGDYGDGFGDGVGGFGGFGGGVVGFGDGSSGDEGCGWGYGYHICLGKNVQNVLLFK